MRVVLLILLAACSTAPPRLAPRHSAQPQAGSTVIYVVRRKWHVDIGFAAADLQPPLASLRIDFPGAQYLLFGFGDRHYLLAKDHGSGGMLAALWPGPGLMLVTALGTTLQAAFGDDNVIEIPITPGEAADAQAFVWRSLEANDGAVSPLLAGPYDGSLYYSSSQNYSAVHTCNTWAAQTLHAANLPVHSFGVELSGQLWGQALRLGQRPGAYPTQRSP
ncbi:MAG TPA: DUF2459 domain-containing protein [Steroidobacteraceae bacterium]|nr:DUF2459 domain-containing protein [Steroidobacteraceae bacterium]